MAKLIFIGAAKAVSQIDTVTMTGTWADTETVTVNVGNKSVTYTCGAGETVTTVASGLLALLQAATEAEFVEITWTSDAGVITATSTAGLPVTITTSDTAASGTSTKANVQAATGPNHWDEATNWSTGAVPTTADEVFIDDASVAVKYGLPTSLTLGKFVHTAGQLGLPNRNASGYVEYRAARAVFTCTDVTFGLSGKGPSLSRVDLASGASAVSVFGSKTRASGTGAAIDLLLNSASASVSVISGQVAIAESGDETTTVGTVRVASQGNVFIGLGTTVTSIVSSGLTTVASAATNVTVDAGTLTLVGASAVTNLTIRGGTAVHNSSGTITAAVVGPGSLDCSQDIRPRTITDLTLKKSGIFRDTYEAVTVTNGIVLGSDADLLTAS